MAAKNNSHLEIDRNAIGEAADLTVEVNKEFGGFKDEAELALKYIEDDSNLSGKETEPFKQTAAEIGKILETVKKKMDVLEKAYTRSADMYNVKATKQTRTSADIFAHIQALGMKFDAAGKA